MSTFNTVVSQFTTSSLNSPLLLLTTRQLFSPTRSDSSLRSCSSTFWSLASSFSSIKETPHITSAA
jgi:hypothetical protein